MSGGLHVELTSKCVLACPSCPRTYCRSDLKIEELPFATFCRAVQQPWQRILLCGNHGDPIYHSEFHRILGHILELPYQPSIFIETNGSCRGRDWWSKTAQCLRARDIVSFSIDGLADTNEIYRKNSDWVSLETAIATLRAESECRLLWKFIVFKHNQHQVVEAFQLAKKWGMSFKLVESTRFATDDPMRPTLEFNELDRRIHDYAQM